MARTLRRSARALWGALLFTGLLSTGALAQDASPLGDWEGTLFAGGQELPVVFHITADEDGVLSSTMDSPSQGAFGIPTGETTFEDGTLTITVPAVPGGGSYEGTLGEDGDTFAGMWSQGGQSIELGLTRAES